MTTSSTKLHALMRRRRTIVNSDVMMYATRKKLEAREFGPKSLTTEDVCRIVGPYLRMLERDR